MQTLANDTDYSLSWRYAYYSGLDVVVFQA